VSRGLGKIFVRAASGGGGDRRTGMICVAREVCLQRCGVGRLSHIELSHAARKSVLLTRTRTVSHSRYLYSLLKLFRL